MSNLLIGTDVQDIRDELKRRLSGAVEKDAAPPPPPGFIREAESTPRHFAQQPGLAITDPSRLAEGFRQARQQRTGIEAIIGKDNLLPFNFLLKGAALGQAVCKIQASGTAYDGTRGARWGGTGFLIGPNVLLTNHHVINSIDVARGSLCIFDYQADVQDRAMPTRAFRLDPSKLFVTSPFELPSGERGLDYTIVWIEVDAEAQRLYGHIPVSRGSFLAKPGDCANVIHHPGGRPKHVTLQDNRIVAVHETVVHYTTDTEQGSSGSAVFTNDWRLLALHHSAEPNIHRLNPLNEPEIPAVVNEGIRLAAIALDLERRLGNDSGGHARRALQVFQGVDSATGYFGGLGRDGEVPAESGSAELVVDDYRGEAKDIDIGFWNVEWLTNRYEEKLSEVGEIIADMNLDIWALSESSPEAARALVKHMRDTWGYTYDCAFSEPDSAAGKQSTTVMWNTQAVERLEAKWPKEVEKWFKVDSRHLGIEAVHGKVFDRYPGLFRFRAKDRASVGSAAFDFFLVPLHLKAMDEGSLRRRQASKILAAAVYKTIELTDEADWIIGGDYNAELASGDFAALTDKKLVPLGAQDEEDGAFTYLKRPNSLIDHIFLSPNLARQYGAQDFFVVARDRKDITYIKEVSDHRPVLVRLALASGRGGRTSALPADLAEVLKKIGRPMA